MPFGPEGMGFAYFAGVKLLGYAGYSGLFIQRKIEPRPGVGLAWKAGAVRTIIGLGVGTVVGLGFWSLDGHGVWPKWMGTPLFYTFLAPIRIFEWMLLLYLVYRSYALTTAKWKLIAGGIVVSFLLDLVGVVAMFVLPGGMWIC